MDAKNLAVLMTLKELMVSSELEKAAVDERPASTAEKAIHRTVSTGGSRKSRRRDWRAGESTTYRGIDVGGIHYGYLVEAVSSTSTVNADAKLEALAFYLERAPDDKGALKAFDRISSAIVSTPKKTLNTAPAPRKLTQGPEIQIRAECSKCRNVYAVSFNRVPPSWVCKSCLRLEKVAKQDEAQAITDRQYAGGTGGLVRQIETKIASLKAILESGSTENPRGLMLQVSQLEKRLKLEKAHAISGFRKIRAYQVPGSYGSNR